MNDFSTSSEKTFWEQVKPWLGSIIILPLAVYYTLNKGQFTFIDYINLLIHEGGHGIFKIFGKFLYTLGGSLMEIIIPGMFIIFYMVKRKKILAQIFMIWLGENLMYISIYAADARAKKLPLLGGNRVYHDWNWILSQLNLLEQDVVIGGIFYGFGIFVFVIALLIPALLKGKNYSRINLNI